MAPGSPSPADAREEMGETASEAAFLECYREHRDRVFRYAMRFGGGRRDFADDLTQEAFIKLMHHWDRLDDPAHVGSWLYRVTANLAISRLRREQSWRDRVRRMWTRDDEHHPPPDRELEEREVTALVAATMDRLPPKQRVVLVMRVLDDMPQKEIAATLDLSEGYVSKLLFRARQTLRKAGWEMDDD